MRDLLLPGLRTTVREAIDDNLYRQLSMAGLRESMRQSYETFYPNVLRESFRQIHERVYANAFVDCVWHTNGRARWGEMPQSNNAFHFPRSPIIEPGTAARSRERARGLLESLLTPEQWAEFERVGEVKEQIGGCEFTLRPGGMIHVRKPQLSTAPVIERWCINPDHDTDYLPVEDQLIGQLLHLRAGPDKLRAQANLFTGF